MRALEVEVDTKIKVAIRLAKIERSEAKEELIQLEELQEEHSGWVRKVSEEQGENSDAFRLAEKKSIELENRRHEIKKTVRMKHDEVQRLREFKRVKISKIIELAGDRQHKYIQQEKKPRVNSARFKGTGVTPAAAGAMLDRLGL